MAKGKKDFSSAFGMSDDFINNDDIKEVYQEKHNEEKNQIVVKENSNIETINNNPNIVITYNNPMQIFEERYLEVLKAIKEENENIMNGFIKKLPQSEIYANVTIQVRRDLYACICNYITDMRMGKTKVLNEIFMLGVKEFISKYSKKNNES